MGPGAELQYVICYDLPWTLAEFVHRVGRIGRMGQRGTAISFFDRYAPHAILVYKVDGNISCH